MRIVIADDHQLFRQGLRLILSNEPTWEVVAEVDNAETLIYLDEANTSYEFVGAKPDAAASVPAPGTLLLSLFGFTALALRRRKTL